MPLLAVLCLYEISRNKQLFNLTSWKGAPLCKRIGLPVASVLTLGLSLLLWVAPGVAGDCISTADMQTFDMMRQAGFPADLIGRYMAAITSMHHAILFSLHYSVRHVSVVGLCHRQVKGVDVLFTLSPYLFGRLVAN